jgi:two-component system, chemotaxis family, protein-glutamate methylesterase/glutaminase
VQCISYSPFLRGWGYYKLSLVIKILIQLTMIKVLIVEDSPVMQELLVYTLQSDPDFKIVGVAADGEEAIKMVMEKHPDVIAMDCYMPKLSGQEATRKIMETKPTPIVIVTGSLTTKDVAITFSLIEAGALAIVKKPNSVNHPEYKKDTRELIQTLKLMSEVKVVKRISRIPKEKATIKPIIEKTVKAGSEIKIVVLGASTGGPLVLQKIISGLPRDFLVPLLIVQHISLGFVNGFVEWLANTTNFPSHVASQGEFPLPGHIYIAPDACHMGVESGPRILLSDHAPENGLRPSVAYLFRTTANIFGAGAVGVLLSGMGRDGAEELKLMKDKGAITIVQNEESSVVFGMPGEAIKLNAATLVLSPEEISSALAGLVKKMNGGGL